MSNAQNRVAIAGVGYSETGRRLAHSDDEMVLQAVTAALDDAGMRPSDVDGIGTMGGNAMAIGQLIGSMPLNWFFTSGGAAPAYVEPAVMAMSAVASGMCHTALGIRLIRQPVPPPPPDPAAPTPAPPEGPVLVGGDQQWSAPFGAGSPTSSIGGVEMQRYLAEYGATEEQFAVHATVQRDYATRNPDALLRDPLTVEDYLASRYISKPLRLLDCDYPCDSASAVIYTTAERARDWRQKPVNVEAWALSAIRDFDMMLVDDFTWNAIAHCSDALWSRTDLNPADVDTAHLYDGFSVITLQWLEGLGFCGRGEAASFIEEGHTAQGGSLPTNTDGGACNVGRRHGANFCIEAVRQIRGQSPNQVPDTEVSVWSNATGVFAGAVLLTA